MTAAPAPGDAEEAIRAYKTILRHVIDQRPSGTRQRLADALGKHRSFVTQITSPAYSTPIPAKHLPTIFAVCHFCRRSATRSSPPISVAHPGKAPASRRAAAHARICRSTVPDLGDDKQNARARRR